jgi:vesicle coat complex subunit
MCRYCTVCFRYAGDDTALNNIDLKCCHVPSAVELCKPHDEKKMVYSCDNKRGKQSVTCAYEKQQGVTTSNSTTKGGSKTDTFGIKSTAEVSANVMDMLQTKFSLELSYSHATEFNWQQTTQSTFDERTTSTITFDVDPGNTAKIYQVVGTCGPYTVYTNVMSRVDE